MKYTENRFTHALRDGVKQIGLWVTLCSNFAAEVVASAGYDWTLVDMEHSHNEYASVLGQLQAFSAYKTVPIVRVEWNDAVAVKRLLDLGAPGILFPMIQTVEEARAAVSATRYPPRGIRGVSGATRATKFGRISDYAARVEDETAVLLQLETLAALEQAEAIADVDGVTGIFFGPADIAADIGMMGQPTAREVWDKVRPVAQRLIQKGVPVGTLVSDVALAAQLLDDGFTFVACGTDTGLLARGSDALLAELKGRVKTA
ncbi:4-hydroxy-2-oxo-heptane-1,7-dioate aldolase [Epibacterium ulvae]|uniref:HpcH/HpaI aldolase family protein n=1 Tax=Epibacterium ulvae TaxID=1156985 RepID=UPI001BFC38DD|nr:aldolase/citrate lyase family protein [Epibacterium ulvae]MBT8152693.1 4-hydroxy-2-oxo-heptane-1,7-dioate aldolase [Epibacterium ulvae]